MNEKFMIEDYFARNMFSRSNMDFSLGEITSEGVNGSVRIFKKSSTL